MWHLPFAAEARQISPTLPQRYDRTTLTRFIQNPETIYRERGKRPLNAKFFPMPNPHASAEDADAIVAYLGQLCPNKPRSLEPSRHHTRS